MAKRGPKPKLNKDVTDLIVVFLKGGNTHRASAEASGICVDTFYEWMKKGAADKEKKEKTEFSDFSDAVTRAEAEAEVLMVDSIRIAARPHDVIEYETITLPDKTTRVVERKKKVHKPEMALEWLKRRRRADWGDSLDIRKLDDESLMRAIEIGRNKKK